jgi:hypothetical protein
MENMMDQNKENKINGMPATPEQIERVLFLQEKKRRIAAESRLLAFEDADTDSELAFIMESVTVASKTVTAVPDENLKEGAA